MKSRVITRSAVGFALGMFIGIVLTVILVTMDKNDGIIYLCVPEFIESVGDPIKAFILEALFSGLLGMVGMGGSSVYWMEEWSILKATVVHFIISLAANFSVCYFLKWLPVPPDGMMDNLIMLIIFIMVYIFIWLSQYFIFRAEVNQINLDLETLKSKELVI